MDSDIDFSSFDTPQAELPKAPKPLAFKPDLDEDGLPDLSIFGKTKPKPKPEPTEQDYDKGADEILKEDTDIPQLYLHAQSTGDKHGEEMARRAYHKQRNQGVLSDVGDVISTLASPSTWGAAASGVADYAVGLTGGLARTGYGVGQGVYGQAGKASADMLRQIAGEESRRAERALAAGDKAGHAKAIAKSQELNLAAEEKEKSAQKWVNAYRGSKMEATLAAQGIENQIRHLGSSALSAVTHVPYKTKSRQQTDAELVQKAIDAKKAMDLQEGNVSDSGLVGYLAGVGGDQPASQTFEEWKAAGAKPDPYWTRVMQAGADPMMYVYAKLPHVPGAQKAGAAGAWAAGKLLRSPQYILDKARRAAKVSKIAKHGATAAGASVVVAEALVHGGFKAGASLAATLLAYGVASRSARIMSAAGVFLESHGRAVMAGKATPGAVRKALGARYGTSVPFSTYLGDFAGQTIVSTGAGMAGGLGLNLLLSGGDPKEFAHLEATAGAFASGMTFLKLASFGARGEHNQAIRKYLVVEGKRLVDFNSKYGAKTKELFDSLTEDSQNFFLEAVGTASNLPFTMPDGTVVPVQIHLIDNQTMKRMVDSIQNGYFDGAGNLFINVDQVSTSNNGKRQLDPARVSHIMGHELGHPLLFNTLRYVYPEQFNALVEVAKEELFNADGTPTKETKEFMDEYNTRLLAGFGTGILDVANAEAVIHVYNYEKAMQLAQNLVNASFSGDQPTAKGSEWAAALGVDIAEPRKYIDALIEWSFGKVHDAAQAELYPEGNPTQKAHDIVESFNKGLENAYSGYLLTESNPMHVAEEWFAESAGQQIASEGFGSAALQSAKMQKIADRIRSLIAAGSGLSEFSQNAKFKRSENPRVARAVRYALEKLASLETKRVGAPSPTGPETSMPVPGAPTAPTSGSPGYVPPVYVPPEELTSKQYARRVLVRNGLSEKKADEWLSNFPDDHLSIDDMLAYKKTTGAPVVKQQATKGGATSRKGARTLLKEAGLTEQQTTDAIRAAQAQRGGVVLDSAELARLALEAHRSKPTAPPSSEGSSLTAAPISPTETSKEPSGTVVSESPASAETGASVRTEGATTSPAVEPAIDLAQHAQVAMASIRLRGAGLTGKQANDAIRAAQTQRGGAFESYVDLAELALAIHDGLTTEPTSPEETVPASRPEAPAEPAPQPITPSEPATPAAPEGVRPMTPTEVLGVVLQAQEGAAAELAKNKRVKIDSKASQDKIKNAGIEALLTAAEDNLEANGLRRRTNPVTGTESIGGLFNPENVVDVELVGMAGITEPMQRTMLELQANIGRPVLVRDYGHAPEARGDVTAASRQMAQEQSTAAERARGAADIQYGDKLFVPLSFSFNLGGPNSEPSVTVTGVSPDKLFNNFKNIKEALKKQKLDVHYSGVDSPLFIADVQGAVVNYTNGWVADGSRPIAGTKPTPGYEPYVMDNASDTPNAKLFYKAENGELVPFSRFLVFNLIMGQEGAISGEKKLTDAQAAYQNLARENAVAVSENGEVNPLREFLNQQMGGHSYTTSAGKVKSMTWSRYTIENPLAETLRVDLIGGPVEEATGQDRSTNIRPSASDESIRQAFAKGYPPAEYSAAGFMPTEGKKPSARFMPTEAIVEPGFYSKAGKVLLDKMPSRTSASQIKGILDPQKGSGVKPDELKWSGLIPYVESGEAAKGFVTKDDVRTFLKDGYGARFEEHKVGTNADGNSFYSIDERWGGEGPVEFSTISNAVRAAEQMFELSHQEAVQFVDETNQSESLQTDNGVKYSKYSLPGGTNYKETVLRMPGVEYTSSHFESVPNYVAHMRTAEHGNGLLIEEIQSDLHQDRRKNGELRLPDTSEWTVNYHGDVGDGLKSYSVISSNGLILGYKYEKSPTDAINAVAKMHKEGVPNAPFNKDWQLQLFKRALKQAVADGKEWIGWTGGEAQAERYGMADERGKGMTQFYDVMLPNEIGKYVKQWGAKIKQSSIEAGIDNSVVRTVWDQPDYQYTNNGWMAVETGQELPYGSPESMALSAFIGRYDESQITGAAKQILRSGDIVGHPKKEAQIWRIDITPEMVSSVSEGQPLFMPAEKEPTPKERAQARKMDREYSAAVQAGDIEKAQEMVDEAQKAAGYDLSHRQKGGDIGKSQSVILFKKRKDTQHNQWGNEHYGTNNYVLKSSELTSIPEWVKEWASDHPVWGKWFSEASINPVDIIESAGAWDQQDFVSQFWSENENRLLDKGIYGFNTPDGAVVFDPSVAPFKSADPIIYDDNGNVIPLSKRFNPAKEDIRFMPPENQHEDGLPDFSAVHILHKRDSFIKPLVKGKNSEVASMLKDSAKEKWGRIIKADSITPAEEEAIVMNGVAEVKTELSKSNNAADWYTEAIKRAIEIASILYPELRDDVVAKKKGFQNAKQAEMVMSVALAITSQNLTVPLNTRYAIQQYESFRATKRFNPKIADKYGTKSKAIIGNLKLANLILEFFTNKTGSIGIALDEMNKFFSADFEVGQLEKYAAEAMQTVDSDASVNVAGRVDDQVKGSAIFGPKIGQGFYQNLIGNFTPVTVDLWCRRMWGRWTGAVLPDGISPTQIAKFVDTMREQGVELPSALRGIKVITATNTAGTEYRTITKSAHDKINNGKGAILEIFGSAKVEMAKWSRIYEKIRIGMTPQEVKEVRSGKLSLEDLAKQVTKHYERRKAEWIKYTASVNKGKKGEDRKKFTAKEKAEWLKAYDKSKGRTQVLKNEDISENKPEWVKNAKVVVDQSQPIDVPTDVERRVITRVINEIRKTLEAEGIKTTNADIQAILWYPEKDIWAVLAGEKESGLKNSYDEEFLKIAESRGFGERARAVFGKPKAGTP